MKHTWVTEGFEAFRAGTFGNGGHNLYVSKKGLLQRIYQYDLNHNGYFDLVFANCQNHHESTPSFLYRANGERRAALPGQGALSGLVADLTGDGYRDIVIAGYYDMAAPFATTDIYYGGPDGYSPNRHIRLPTPFAESCCAGDFKGDGRPALAFAMPNYRTVRIFYPSELGLEWKRFVDLPIDCGQVAAADLDGDGRAELVIRRKDDTGTVIYWGTPDGIDLDHPTVIPALPEREIAGPEVSNTIESGMEKRLAAARLLQIVRYRGKPCITLSSGKKLLFFACGADRNFTTVLDLPVPMAMAAAVGDIFGSGGEDLAVACRAPHPEDPALRCSYVFRDTPDGPDAAHPVRLDAPLACDVALADLDGGGRAWVVLAQGASAMSYTAPTLLFRFGDDGRPVEMNQLSGEDCRRVFAVENPGEKPEILLVNHYARSAVGFDLSYIYWGGPDGYRADRRTEVPGWCAVDSLAADFDDDGWAELMICNNSENSLHLDPGCHVHHFGPGGFEPAKSYLLPTELGWGAVTGDFNRNGYLDIAAVGNHWSDIYIFPGGPDGFGPPQKIPLGNARGARWILAVDLDANGYLDLVVPIISGERTIILRGGPEGFSMERHSELAVYRGSCARAADLTGNGYPDLLIGTHIETPQNGDLSPHWPHQSYLHIYWNGPEGLSESRKMILRAEAAVAMAIADFNNDGNLDVFVSNYHNGKDRDIDSYIYWNRGGRFCETDCERIFAHSASGCVAADFNEDGYVDLAVANHKVWGDHHGFSSVHWNGPDGFDRRRRTDLPTEGPHGMTALEPGNLLDRGPEEFYTSTPFRAEEEIIVERVDCEGEIPPKTWVRALVRTAADAAELDAAPWQEPGQLRVPAGQVLQYRLALGAVNSLRTPRISRVAVHFSPVRRPEPAAFGQAAAV